MMKNARNKIYDSNNHALKPKSTDVLQYSCQNQSYNNI